MSAVSMEQQAGWAGKQPVRPAALFFDERPEMRSAGTVPVCFFSRERPEMLFICAKIFVYL